MTQRPNQVLGSYSGEANEVNNIQKYTVNALQI